ncbi:glycosyltransferase involved in cell wall biosynthesis [Mycobacterium frederiksbergense]|uniref:Glycosyltransferase involved in cell wall biosynthesis n=1 Tax=Mycolicibacterium frederiksbergense TaxID=117567 RepID=A0ABT6KZT4_9MYCO|nr:glycosyltransferase [Mycolicibacterium frederiksbergense]MDH6196213.1 glycosyltransferase involved in cell wall biosynthesis [Mycolicibacterium frederiksbergense]
MRILQVVTLLSPDGAFGGPARVALNQSAELLSRGHEVTVVAAARGYRDAPGELNGVPVKLFAAKTVLPRTGFAGVCAPGLGQWLRSNWGRFDVTHIHLGRDLVVMPVAAAARRRGISYLLQTHGMVAPTNHPLAAPLDRVWTRKILCDARAVFFLNQHERQQLVAFAGPDLRLVQLDNGVPRYPAAGPPSGRPEVLFAARMHPRKRPVAFVETAKILLDAGIDAQFTLVGPDEGEGPALREALEGDPRITWEGALAPDAVPARMAAAEVYVLPSVREPHPMSVLEAMSVGLPVVVTNDCGLAPMVEESRSGIATEPTVTALVAAIDSILGDRPHARSMGERGRETVHTHFGMRRVGDRLLDTYSDVAEGRR